MLWGVPEGTERDNDKESAEWDCPEEAFPKSSVAAPCVLFTHMSVSFVIRGNVGIEGNGGAMAMQPNIVAIVAATCVSARVLIEKFDGAITDVVCKFPEATSSPRKSTVCPCPDTGGLLVGVTFTMLGHTKVPGGRQILNPVGWLENRGLKFGARLFKVFASTGFFLVSLIFG